MKKQPTSGFSFIIVGIVILLIVSGALIDNFFFSKAKASASDQPEVTAIQEIVSNPVAETNNPKPHVPNPNVPSETQQTQANQGKESVQNWVYLTLDDGPNKVSTPLILDILDKYDIKATFFVIGKHIEDNKELLIEIDQREHYVANHTYSHSYKKIYASDQAFVKDLEQNEVLLMNLINKKPAVIREPGGKLLGKYQSPLHKRLVKLGYNRLEWDIDSFDSRSPVPSKDVIFSNVKNQVLKKEAEGKNAKLVILLHDTDRHLSTIEVLPQIIDFLRAQGYGFALPD